MERVHDHIGFAGLMRPDSSASLGLGPPEHVQDLAAPVLAQELEEARAEVGVVHGATLAGGARRDAAGNGPLTVARKVV